MANDLDLYESGGDLAPYSPSQPLAPTPADTWGNTDVDYLTDNTPQLTPDATPQQVQQNLAQLEGMFLSDFLTLGHDRRYIDATARLFRECVDQGEPQNVRKEHNYNCFQYSSDPIFNHIANHLYKLGAPQKFIENLAYWVSELEKRLGVSPVGESAPVALTNTQNWIDSLSDAEYEAHIRNNEIARARTESVLRSRWGVAYEQNRRSADAYLKSLPTAERQHFDQLTTGGIHALNTVEVVSRLFDMSIGSNNLPSGGALATEIAQIENLMRTNRKAYNNDLQIQARLRTLYDLRGY